MGRDVEVSRRIESNATRAPRIPDARVTAHDRAGRDRVAAGSRRIDRDAAHVGGVASVRGVDVTRAIQSDARWTVQARVAAGDRACRDRIAVRRRREHHNAPAAGVGDVELACPIQPHTGRAVEPGVAAGDRADRGGGAVRRRVNRNALAVRDVEVARRVERDAPDF